MTKRRLIFVPLLFLLTLGLMIGCSQKTAPAKVSGTVTYKGAPVTGGNLAFHTDSGVYSAALRTDGTFEASDLPIGDVTVTVDTESLNPSVKKETYMGQSSGGPGGASSKYGKGGSAPPPVTKGPPVGVKGAGKQEKSPAGEDSPQGDPGHYVKIPRAYADKTKSTLKVNLKEGTQQITLELKD